MARESDSLRGLKIGIAKQMYHNAENIAFSKILSIHQIVDTIDINSSKHCFLLLWPVIKSNLTLAFKQVTHV